MSELDGQRQTSDELEYNRFAGVSPFRRADAGDGAIGYWLVSIPASYWIAGFLLLAMPVFTSQFVLYQIFSWALILGMIALSLMFIGGYGGMVSLAQMSVAGLAGYMLAILGDSAITDISVGWPWWLAVPAALFIATVFATITGMLAVRTEGIYTIMITLAIAAAFFYFTRQNYVLFNGFSGFNGLKQPTVFGVDWNRPTPFYYLTLMLAALSYFFVLYVSRSPFGLALQGVRDNARRMSALGFNVTAHRVAAFAVAGFIAAMGGILLVWLNGQISPGTIAINPAIDILIIAIVGGLRRPLGPFIGALIYVLLRTFSIDVLTSLGLSGERFQLLIGLGFLIIVYWSPDGVLGLWDRWREKRRNSDPWKRTAGAVTHGGIESVADAKLMRHGKGGPDAARKRDGRQP